MVAAYSQIIPGITLCGRARDIGVLSTAGFHCDKTFQLELNTPKPKGPRQCDIVWLPSDVDFGGALTSSTGVIHAVFFYPEDVATDHAGSGGGPGLGVREATDGAPFYISGDGASWARFDAAYELGVEPVRALLRGGARVLSEMDGEVLLVGGGGDEGPPKPVQTVLAKPFPNPFNPRVELAYSLAQPGRVTLQVFDVKGRLVDTLVSQAQPVGRYTEVWNGTDHEGESVASGVYFARFVSGEARMTHRMVLIR